MASILLSLLAISGISAVLALFLEIADLWIADYGEKKILINDRRELNVKGGAPLLSSLADNDIFLPSACGGKGTCAYCKVKILEGGGPVLPTETPYLTKEELKDNVRISCQVKVKEDLRIEMPDEFFLVRRFNVRVNNIEVLTPDIKAVYLDILDSEEGINFKPGQYVQLEVPPSKLSYNPEFRAYSVASPAGEKHRVELVVTEVTGGVVSTYIHEYLKKGDLLSMRGPFGDFYLRESDRDLLFIATGSGLAPIRSILYQLKEEGINRKATLFFGDRTPVDLYYYEELREMEKTLPDFTYVPTLSRTTAEHNWHGEKGRVTALIEKYVPDKAPLDAYICGAPAMVQSCIDLLLEKGIPEANIFYDKFE